jgi:hypothetical protein
MSRFQIKDPEFEPTRLEGKKVVVSLYEGEVDVMQAALYFFLQYGEAPDTAQRVAVELSRYLVEQQVAQILSRQEKH